MKHLMKYYGFLTRYSPKTIENCDFDRRPSERANESSSTGLCVCHICGNRHLLLSRHAALISTFDQHSGIDIMTALPSVKLQHRPWKKCRIDRVRTCAIASNWQPAARGGGNQETVPGPNGQTGQQNATWTQRTEISGCDERRRDRFWNAFHVLDSKS